MLSRRGCDGLTPGQQLAAITERTTRLTQAQQKVWGLLHGELGDVGIEVIGPSSAMEAASEAWLRDHFLNQVLPILTPQALEAAGK